MEFPLSFSESEIQAFSYAFIAFTTGIAAFFIFSTGARERGTRAFAFLALFAALINIFAFLYYTVENFEIAREIRVVSQAFVIPFYIFLIAFCFDIYRGYKEVPRRERLLGYFLVALELFFVPFFIFDALGAAFIVGEVIASPAVKLTPLPGPLLLSFIGLASLITLYALYVLFVVWRNAPEKSARRQAALLFLFLGIPIVTRLFGYAGWYGYPGTSLILTLITGPAFAFGVTYAIVRHQVFNLRLITTQVLLFALWTFIFVKAILSPSWIAALPDIGLLAAAIILGIFLIRSVLKEVAQRGRLEVLTGELESLNTTLEEKVRDRTAALNRAKEHTETVFENLTFGLIEYTEGSIVTRINKAAEIMLGVDRRSVVGRAFPTLSPGAPQSLLAVLHAKPLRKKPGPKDILYDIYAEPAEAVEIIVETPKRRELQVITSPIVTIEGDEHRSIKLIRDVTRERIIDRSKTEFISIASHQLRTPLTALKWIFNLLTDGSLGRLSVKQKELAVKGNDAADRMIKLTNDLLQAAQIEDGRFGYNFAKGDLGALVAGEVGNLLVVAHSRGIELSFSEKGHVPSVVFDATWMSLVIQNLIDNALKYSEKGDTVTVTLLEEKGRALLSVRDTGIGMTEEERSRLFTKFFRSKKALSLFTDGSGLGLFIVRKIIEQHDGTIRVESEEGVGTTVVVELPLHA